MLLPIATAPDAPTAVEAPIFVTSIVPDPLALLILIVLNFWASPIAPWSWIAPVPLVIARASVCVAVPLIFPSTVMLPAPVVPVVNVVVPLVLRTRSPVLNDRFPAAVVTVGDAAVSRIVLPDLAS